MKLIEIFNNSTFVNTDYIYSVIKDQKLKGYFINNDFINDDLWEKIIAPYSISNKTELLNEFKKIQTCDFSKGIKNNYKLI